jgi:hypothetical protein
MGGWTDSVPLHSGSSFRIAPFLCSQPLEHGNYFILLFYEQFSTRKCIRDVARVVHSFAECLNLL